MDYLASVTDLKVFGCSIDFLQTATQTYLEDPIWDRLQQGMAYTIVFKDSSVILPSQEQLEGCPIHHVSFLLLANATFLLAQASQAAVPCYGGLFVAATLVPTAPYGWTLQVAAFRPIA